MPTRKTQTRPTPPPSPPPQGPRPLAYHLNSQVLTWISCLSALPYWKNGSLSLSTGQSPHEPGKSARENELIERARAVDEQALQRAIIDEALRRLKAFTEGVSAYHQHPRERSTSSPPVLSQIGAARLLDYGLPGKPGGLPVLIIPSLINRAYILDLDEDRSLVRYLAKAGMRPLLVDWGSPGKDEADYDLSAYITGPLQSFFDICRSLDSRPPPVVGYCMGGLLALALASRNRARVSALALLATPWDFHTNAAGQIASLKALKPGIELLLEQINHLPVDILQAMFAGLAPSSTPAKFQSYSQMKPDSPQAQAFVQLEDWLNDGVPLTAGVARDCLFGWYLENQPYNGKWVIDGNPVLPQELDCPSLTLIPSRDIIVPPASAKALARALPHNESRAVPAGHIGMAAGSNAKSCLYEPLREWIELKDTSP